MTLLQSNRKALDGGWGWAVVAACFMAQLLAYGSPQSVGVLYPEWLTAFKEGKGMTAWVGSLVSGVGLIASPVCSACVVNFGARPVTIFSGVMVSGGLMLSAFAPNVPFLIFSYGIVVGLGCGLLWAATLTITCQYFDKRQGLALGIVTTGTSVGGFLYATAQVEFIQLFGLDGCLMIIGALALNIIACAGPMRALQLPTYYLRQRAAALERAQEQLYAKARTNEESVKPSGANNKNPHSNDLLITIETKDNERGPLRCSTNEKGPLRCSALLEAIKAKQSDYSQYLQSTAELLQDRVFMCLCVALFCFSLGAFPPLLFLEDVAQSQGLIDGISRLPLVSIVAISQGVGKLLLGVTADLKGVDSVVLYSLTVLGSGVALVLIPLSQTYVLLQLLAVGLGFLSGNWSLTSYCTTSIVGIDRLTQAHGILMFFGGFGVMLGPPVVGWFYDWTLSYDLAFYLSGACVMLGGACLLLAALPCGDKKTEGRRPELEYRPGVQHNGSCEQVASVA
ncbi:monocarboxylate transporter 9b [Esox lucius]|uniref:Major facilitator superfamily (MFS) profile domain-containing protein n=1 Tax=Esox lucius TaxID=8010 RepID=A0A3P8YMX7_ESOLU|nr:monocarboxylate transporter 9b [Esox lucius]XP_019902603.1 monocarboxylate transporter 9b [Esox lucius]XP_019902604.1 monocarboxylate transporter 9b [Esox lucius]